MLSKIYLALVTLIASGLVIVLMIMLIPVFLLMIVFMIFSLLVAFIFGVPIPVMKDDFLVGHMVRTKFIPLRYYGVQIPQVGL